MINYRRSALIISAVLTGMFLAVNCNAETGAETLELKLSGKKSHGKTIAGEIIIEIKKGVVDLGEHKGVVPVVDVTVNSASLAAVNKRYGLVSVERLFSGTRKDEPSDIYVFRFSPKVNVGGLILDYKKERGVIYAEPNGMVSSR